LIPRDASDKKRQASYYFAFEGALGVECDTRSGHSLVRPHLPTLLDVTQRWTVVFFYCTVTKIHVCGDAGLHRRPEETGRALRNAKSVVWRLPCVLGKLRTFEGKTKLIEKGLTANRAAPKASTRASSRHPFRVIKMPVRLYQGGGYKGLAKKILPAGIRCFALG